MQEKIATLRFRQGCDSALAISETLHYDNGNMIFLEVLLCGFKTVF